MRPALTGLFAGSFDPITLGHLDIITRALSFVDHLVVGLGVHASKAPLFSSEQRQQLVRQSIQQTDVALEKSVTVVPFDGLLVQLAKQHKVGVMVRSLRTSADFDYESPMVWMNKTLEKKIETIFLSARPEVGFISSTLVRQIAGMGGDVTPFVPPCVAQAFSKK